ncbi:nucleotidyltransferase family protein [Sulfitobacter sp. F26169L]|uniref:nucleotidyltransferase family protein n=1 Tax=Sulfitobacter sp. F26169L TaxID=2996015 RepID=UPI002260F42C|nr:nucleotidyltransferase family protein [Sulfitobacter sp. F26169L]MCX7565307.1 nucleotidyltransferase family protein [Sulfitobacter sp. F26169L]
MIAIVILAAGAARRMQGRDKLMEEVNGVPLLRRQTLRALDTTCPVLVTLPPAPHQRYDVINDLGVTLVPVPDPSEGMNASLRAGLAALPDTAEAVMVMLADMPDITVNDLNTILQGIDLDAETRIWRATTQTGAAGHPIVFHRSLIPELLNLWGDAGGREVVKAHADKTLHIPLPENHARTDLDTPQAWAAWRAGRRKP